MKSLASPAKSRHLAAALTAIGLSVSAFATTSISSADYNAVPVGETISLTGTGFSGTTAATFFWSTYVDSASFNVDSDTSLKVTFPNPYQPTRDRVLLVETSNGSTIAMPGPTGSPSAFEFTGVGTLSPFPPKTHVIVNSGAVLTGVPNTVQVLCVQSGGVIQSVPASMNGVILAENGATLDLRGTTFSTLNPPLILYSPGTTILGTLPPPSSGLNGSVITPRQIPPLSISRAIGTFTTGIPLNLSTVGNGTATVSPNSAFLRSSSPYTLSAQADPGWIFQGWSGSINSTNPNYSGTTGSTALNITATFTEGYTLETYAGSGGTISPNPALETYAQGQVIQLTATPAPGLQFVGWGGDLIGSTDNPVSLTMTGHKLVTAIFEKASPSPFTHITSTDHKAVPIGEAITLTGMGFTDATAATFFWSNQTDSAAFNVVSDNSMEVTFPDASQPTRDRVLLVESPSGSTITMADPPGSPSLTEFTGVGSISPFPPPSHVIVNPGAVLTGVPSTAQVLCVQSGALLRSVPASMNGVILAENGATLDLRGTTFSTLNPPLILYSPGTTILGTLPPPSLGLSGRVITPRQIPPLSISRGIGTFSVGFQLTLSAEGPGAITADPEQAYYSPNSPVSLTATPSPDKYFIRWTGGASSTSPTVTVRLSGNTTVVARFSDRSDYFSDWRLRYFTIAELADPEISGLNADPDGDKVTNAGEYAFGTNPRNSDGQNGFKILPGSNPKEDAAILLEYHRPTYAADINYILQAKQGTDPWIDGSTGNVTYTTTEELVEPLGENMEKVRLRVTFTNEIPGSLFFQLTANIEDL